MYKPPYMPFYVDDYEADTAHLTLEEDGVYNRLLRLCWRTAGCSLPDDPTWIARKMRVDLDGYHRLVEPIIREFFRRENGRIFQGRQRTEWKKANEVSARRSEAGRKGGRPRKALENNETGKSRAKANEKQIESNQNQNQNHTKREAKASPKRGSRLPDEWALPKEWGEWALGEGMDELSIRREAERFKDYWHSLSGQKAVKADWFATWRNWCRKAMERGADQRRGVDVKKVLGLP